MREVAEELVLHAHTLLYQKSNCQSYNSTTTSFCCNGQQSGSPKVVRSLKSNRAIGTVRPFRHWKASAADPNPEGPGWVGGSNLYTEPKDLETNHKKKSKNVWFPTKGLRPVAL